MTEDITANPECEAQTTTPARERRINTLIRGLKARRYLEVGVFKGVTFLHADVEHKTGVDPLFRFDKSLADKPGVTLCEVESDTYFSTLAVQEKFDFIYLDGLHTFEQTYRDLTNALLHSHDRTVILIDDTLPSDVYSAIPDQALCLRRRKEAGGTGNAWHGDVFKTIFALHDFHPGLDYRTIVGSGNPQTPIWRSSKGWRKPQFNCLEAISRLSYFDMLKHRNILRKASEQDAIAACLADLSELLPAADS